MVAVIFIGGAGPSTMPNLPSAPTLRIAADAGLDLAVRLGEEVDVVIGDLDSVDPGLLAAARDRGVEVREYPGDKDLTDLELALEAALAVGTGPESTELIVVGGGGGRLDHLLGVLAALAAAARRGVDVTGYLGDDQVWLVGPGVRLELTTRPGTTISLAAVGAPATVKRAAGLQWSLNDVTLSPFHAVGVSNRAVSPAVTVEVLDGVLAVIAPAPEVTRPEIALPVPPSVGTAAPAGRFRPIIPRTYEQPGAPQ